MVTVHIHGERYMAPVQLGRSVHVCNAEASYQSLSTYLEVLRGRSALPLKAWERCISGTAMRS